ncbi:TrkA family potassium uptake protein [Blastococcus sp. Marseille-P5729]|uniref:potassium channel family protein n=1 Tax=Blastococcus sp. Marseille-P5729 TaxID=2086582 RepID=UPI000D1046C8|nr:TrkA family potassium uptake protein [Blastococcus sp. Marseille-P5729]
MARKNPAAQVVVIGLGRFGSSLALELERNGTEVLGIDAMMKNVQPLVGELTHVVQADATDEEAMRQLGVHEFERAVIAIGTHLESSILATSMVRGFGVQEIWAKAMTEAHARILRQLDVKNIVRPEADMGKRVAHLIGGRQLDYIEFDDGYALIKMRPPTVALGVPLGESDIRQRFGVTVVGVKRIGQPFTYATNETVLELEDIIIISGDRRKVEAFSNLD